MTSPPNTRCPCAVNCNYFGDADPRYDKHGEPITMTEQQPTCNRCEKSPMHIEKLRGLQIDGMQMEPDFHVWRCNDGCHTHGTYARRLREDELHMTELQSTQEQQKRCPKCKSFTRKKTIRRLFRNYTIDYCSRCNKLTEQPPK